MTTTAILLALFDVAIIAAVYGRSLARRHAIRKRLFNGPYERNS